MLRIALAGLWLLCVSTPAHADALKPDRWFYADFGRKRANVVLRAERVDVFLGALDSPPYEPPTGKFSFAKGPFPLDPKWIAPLRAAVAKPGNVEREQYEKPCAGFRPSVAFRFLPPKAGDAPTELLLCFDCEELAVVRPGQPLVLFDMANVSLRLLEIALSALPKGELTEDLERWRARYLQRAVNQESKAR